MHFRNKLRLQSTASPTRHPLSQSIPRGAFMTVVSEAVPAQRVPGLLARENTIAGPRFNRWLVPPAALAIHLCIGMAYGFSVFWLPMTKLLAGGDAAACANLGFFAQLFNSSFK